MEFKKLAYGDINIFLQKMNGAYGKNYIHKQARQYKVGVGLSQNVTSKQI
jgi:hypothetical protein